MSLLDTAKAMGFSVRLKANGNLGISPWSEITDEQKNWFKENKPEIIEELKAVPKAPVVAKKKAAATEGAVKVEVGTILEEVISSKIPDSLLSLVPKSTCGCSDYKKKMNIWGIDGCIERKDMILNHLLAQSAKMGVISTAIPRTVRRKIAEKLFNRAIDISRQRQAG